MKMQVTAANRNDSPAARPTRPATPGPENAMASAGDAPATDSPMASQICSSRRRRTGGLVIPAMLPSLPDGWGYIGMPDRTVRPEVICRADRQAWPGPVWFSAPRLTGMTGTAAHRTAGQARRGRIAEALAADARA